MVLSEHLLLNFHASELCVACVAVKSLPGMCQAVFAEVYTAVGCLRNLWDTQDSDSKVLQVSGQSRTL